MNTETLYNEIFQLGYTLMTHPLMRLESTRLLYNTNQELERVIKRQIDRLGGRIYLCALKTFRKNNVLSIRYKKGDDYKMHYDQNAKKVTSFFSSEYGTAIPIAVCEDIKEKLTGKLVAFDEKYNMLKLDVDSNMGIDLDYVLRVYDYVNDQLLHPSVKNKKYNAFHKWWYYHKDDTLRVIWTMETKGAKLPEEQANAFLQQLCYDGSSQLSIDPPYIIPFMMGLLPKFGNGKKEGEEVEKAFNAAFDFLEKATADNGVYQTMPRLKYLQEQYKKDNFRKTRIGLIYLFEQVYAEYYNFCYDSHVDDTTRRISEQTDYVQDKYILDGVWQDKKNTCAWTIHTVEYGYWLYKIEYKGNTVARQTRYDVFIEQDDNQIYLRVNDPSKLYKMFEEGIVPEEACSRYVFTASEVTKTRIDGEDFMYVEEMELKVKRGDRDILRIPKLYRAEDSQINCFKNNWNNVPQKRDSYFLVRPRLVSIFSDCIYIGSFDYNDEGTGFKHYYRISKDNGYFGNCASQAKFGQSISVVRLFDDKGKPLNDYINFDMAAKWRLVPTSEEEEDGMAVCCKEETDALNMLFKENMKDLKEMESRMMDPFYFDV